MRLSTLVQVSPTSENPIRIRPEILAVPPYRQGSAPTRAGFKLSSNENPFPPLPAVERALVAQTGVNLYAGAAMPELRAAIGARFGLDAESSMNQVHLAPGSVAILYQLVQAVAGPGERFVVAWPSFEGYPFLGLASGAECVQVPLAPGARHDLDAMADACSPETRAVILCSPNNPTGPAVMRAEFDRFMARVPTDTLVILDEAYREFVTDPEAVRGEEVLGLFPNLVVLRTFSKAFGLAGLRIGYAVGDQRVLDAARTTAIPLAVTGQAEAAARATLAPESLETLERQIHVLVARRDALAAALRAQGYDVPDAQGNFVWCALPGGAGRAGGAGETDGSAGANGSDAAAVPAVAVPAAAETAAADFAAAFAAAGTLVRPFPGHGVRISVGEPESIQEVLRITGAYAARGQGGIA
jgi:histidinol-phosphate aminotransferase